MVGLLDRIQGPFARRPDRDYYSALLPISDQKVTELDYGGAARKRIIDPAAGLLGDVGRGATTLGAMAHQKVPFDRDLAIKSSVDFLGCQALRGATLPAQAGVLASTPIKKAAGILGDTKPKDEPRTMRDLIASGVDDPVRYIATINPTGRRIDNPTELSRGDMYGMLPSNAQVIKQTDDITFYEKDGNFYATQYNPDVGEQDVIGYITRRGDETDLSVVRESQGQGVGTELMQLYLSLIHI